MSSYLVLLINLLVFFIVGFVLYYVWRFFWPSRNMTRPYNPPVIHSKPPTQISWEYVYDENTLLTQHRTHLSTTPAQATFRSIPTTETVIPYVDVINITKENEVKLEEEKQRQVRLED